MRVVVVDEERVATTSAEEEDQKEEEEKDQEEKEGEAKELMMVHVFPDLCKIPEALPSNEKLETSDIFPNPRDHIAS